MRSSFIGDRLDCLQGWRFSYSPVGPLQLLHQPCLSQPNHAPQPGSAPKPPEHSHSIMHVVTGVMEIARRALEPLLALQDSLGHAEEDLPSAAAVGHCLCGIHSSQHWVNPSHPFPSQPSRGQHLGHAPVPPNDILMAPGVPRMPVRSEQTPGEEWDVGTQRVD